MKKSSTGPESACKWTTMGNGSSFPCMASEEHDGRNDHVFATFGLDLHLVVEAAKRAAYDKRGPFIPPWNDRLQMAIRRITGMVPVCGRPWPKDASVMCTLLAGHDVKLREHAYASRHCFRSEDTQIEWDE